jgi:hypothetical protein
MGVVSRGVGDEAEGVVMLFERDRKGCEFVAWDVCGCCEESKEGDGCFDLGKNSCSEIPRRVFSTGRYYIDYVLPRLLLLCFYVLPRVLWLAKMTACDVFVLVCGMMDRAGLYSIVFIK